MPNEYTLSDLVKLSGVSPRTVRYYIAQGLLPSPSQAGPAARYTDAHLDRLRLIRKLQASHLPLAEIRNRLRALPDDQLAAMAEGLTPEPPPDSALDYIRDVLGERPMFSRAMPAPSAAPRPAPAPAAAAPAPSAAPPPAPAVPAYEPSTTSYRRVMLPEPEAEPAPTPPAPAQTTQPDRAQWERISLDPDVELHVRRPLTRQLNKRVERLISIARQLLEEE